MFQNPFFSNQHFPQPPQKKISFLRIFLRGWAQNLTLPPGASYPRFATDGVYTILSLESCQLTIRIRIISFILAL